MRNLRDWLLSGGFCGKKRQPWPYEFFMSQEKRPAVFTTSISGIQEELWEIFRNAVANWKTHVDRSYTQRKALEEGIFRLYKEVQNPKTKGGHRYWPSPTRGKSVPIQISNEARHQMEEISTLTGHKKNTIILKVIHDALSFHLDIRNDVVQLSKEFPDIIPPVVVVQPSEVTTTIGDKPHRLRKPSKDDD